MKKESFFGKKVLVMGLGRFGGGVDVVRFAHGAGAKVTVTDLASAQILSDSINQLQDLDGIEYHLGSHDPADFEHADIIIANPAVPNDNEFLQIARTDGKCVTSQVSIFFELCPAPIIGITGANGKSTTTALTAHLLVGRRSSVVDRHTTCDIQHTRYENVWLSGNIGNKPLLSTMDQIRPNDLVVLELSSFQLEHLAQIQKAPQIALLTNLTPNHLDRHGTFANYCAAKETIFRFQKRDKKSPAISIFNAEDKIASEWFERYKSDPDRICMTFSAADVGEEIRSVFPLPGRANLSNLAAAMAIAKHFSVDEEQIKSCLPEFKSLPHRLELVRELDGVRWYNDSIATTPQSAITALDAFEQPVVIIAGGYDKNLPFDELGKKIVQRAKAAILIGTTAQKIASAINNAKMSLDAKRSNFKSRNTQYAIRNTNIEIVDSFAKAIDLAHDVAASGDVVLLSPACASYDMFDNFEHRGKEFINLVQSFGTKQADVETGKK
jgi:UDP-N-acetylmuramoylalanine--D-glutamate ligase